MEFLMKYEMSQPGFVCFLATSRKCTNFSVLGTYVSIYRGTTSRNYGQVTGLHMSSQLINCPPVIFKLTKVKVKHLQKQRKRSPVEGNLISDDKT